MVEVKVKKLHEDAHIPLKAYEADAGFDLYAYIPEGAIRIPAQKNAKIGTGVAVAIPEGYFGAIYARSGLSTKQGLRLANGTGVIDSLYRGELIVPIYNDNPLGSKEIRHGEKIAQLVIHPLPQVIFKEVDNLDETERGEGGFGSTGMG